MAQISGTLDTYAQKGKAEDFRDVIYTIAVEKMPFLATVGKTDEVKAKKHMWQTDALRAPAANAQIEGDEAAFTSPGVTAEVGNHTQISRETLIVSGTSEAIRLYGRKSDKRRLLQKKATETVRDIERAIVATNVASLAGNSSTAALSGSLTSWLTTNVSRGVGGANGGYNSGTGLTVAATDGTQRAFTEALVKTVQQSCFTSGSQPSIAMMSPKHKGEFSAFAGIAVNRVDMPKTEAMKKQAIILGAADMYQGDFGLLTVVANPFMSSALGSGRQRDCFLIDPEYLEVGYLRRMATEKLAKTGDADKTMLVCEWTLVVKNEAALGVVADLT